MRGSEESGGCANDLEEDAAVMPSGMVLEVRIDGLREQEGRLKLKHFLTYARTHSDVRY